jgi:hypothetical protein
MKVYTFSGKKPSVALKCSIKARTRATLAVTKNVAMPCSTFAILSGNVPCYCFTIMKRYLSEFLICIGVAALTNCVGLGSDSSPGLLTGLFMQPPASGSGQGMQAGTDQAGARAAAAASWKIDQDPTVVSLTAKVKRDPRGALPELVKALVKGRKDDFERARALHDWVAENIAYDFGAFKGTSPTIVTPYEVIGHGASVCEGYASLYQLMCSLAGLECTVVSGYGRGYGFDGFAEDSLPYSSDHAWNAVRINGGWYLVDTTWDAGGVDTAGTFTRSYSTGYLFTPPGIFLCTHFPGDPRWQLSANPVSYESFKSLPYVRGSFGTVGLQWQGDLARFATVGASHEILFTVPAGISLSASMHQQGQGDAVEGAIATRRVGDTVRARMLFPAPGLYEVMLFGYAGNDMMSMDWFGTLYFKATAGSDQRLPNMLPQAYSLGFSFDNPDGYTYKVKGGAAVGFTGPQGITFNLTDSSDKWCENRVYISGTGSARVAHVSFPSAGAYTLWVFAADPDKPGTSNGIASFTYQATEASAIEYPSITDAAARAGFSMGDDPGYLPRVGGETQVTFTYPGDVRAYMFDAAGKAQTGRVLSTSNGGKHVVRLSFPSSGDFTVWMYAAPSGGSPSNTALASVHFSAQAASDRTFPEIYDSGITRGFSVVAPLDGTLKAGQNINFDVEGPPNAAVYVSIGGTTITLKEKEGHYSGSARASGTQATIFARGQGETTAYGLAGYVIK